ncbi:unnamed protein product [Victoria cruziana]
MLFTDVYQRYQGSDGYKNTGCYNLRCRPGFVQLSKRVVPDMPLPPSDYKGPQYYMEIVVLRDQKTGNWWLNIQNEWIGYWPKTIFTSLASGATLLEWGGEIFTPTTGVHTATEMGSGHFPSEGGDGISASFNKLIYVDQTYKVWTPATVTTAASRPKCYNIGVAGNVGAKRGYTFFFGGPGRNAYCP